ncbi:hypothetical protein [Flavobacterium sp. HNIBRBA15423]|uniref:hypothetical protein n=1 Tax=Flavobacterium sp. HNIBRBA15423 TaxID=3458683 RepID=UPI004043B599
MSKLKSIASFKETGLFLTSSQMETINGSMGGGDVPSHQTGYSETCNNNVEDTRISNRYDSSFSTCNWGPWIVCCVSDCTMSQLVDNTCN